MTNVDEVSKAIACLRVLVQGKQGKPTSTELNILVGKLINAFLESRWAWPRQFIQMTPFAYILSDPRVRVLDTVSLQALAHELQVKLFGASGSGEVTLLVFEGSELETHRFANIDINDLRKMTAGEGSDIHPPFEGQLNRLTAKGVQSIPIGPSTPSPGAAQPLRFSAPKFDRNYDPVYRGVYSIPSGRFIGDLALCKPLHDNLVSIRALYDIAPEEFDEGCVESAIAAVSQSKVGGVLYVPLNFSSLIRPAGRTAYAQFLSRLPAAQRARLVASIYETPRDPSFFALSEALRFLANNFARVELLVSDPGFEVEKLPAGVVGYITLALPEAEPRTRLAAIRTFMKDPELFKRRQIGTGVSRIATRTEVAACVARSVTFISGPGVSGLSLSPLGAATCNVECLPVRLSATALTG
jgi:hypothetical protein